MKFRASGKFLITGEYAVLAGIPALAIPLKLGQEMEVLPRNDGIINWTSYNVDDSIWYEDTFAVTSLNVIGSNPVTNKIKHLLQTILSLNPDFCIQSGFTIKTTLNFDRQYGMGTSSTLVSLLSQWSGCNAYSLQFTCFGGSGYDIACASATGAIIYTYDVLNPLVEETVFRPKIKNNIFFVYLNQKQNSRDSIARFDDTKLTTAIKKQLSEMPQRFIEAGDDLNVFNKIITEHEKLIGNLIGLQPVKENLFPDYRYAIKSLGGWGGDFLMATGKATDKSYFIAKGYKVILDWEDVVL